MSHKITYGPVDKSTVGLLRIIHRKLLPVTYSNGIYNTIKQGVDAKGELAFYNDDTAVGEMCYKIDKDSEEKKLYIMTIGVLEPYRKLGIASSLIKRATEANPEATTIYLHVHVDNKEGISFYEKLGFSLVETIPEYYSSLENGTALMYSRKIEK